MRNKVTVFLKYVKNGNFDLFVEEMDRSNLVENIIIISDKNIKCKLGIISSNSIIDSKTIKKIAEITKTDFALIQIDGNNIIPGQNFIERFVTIARSTSAGLLYSDYYGLKNNKTVLQQTIEYQKGSIRDDFDFGSFVLIEVSALKNAAANLSDYKFAAFYSLRLAISRHHLIFRIPECLYTKQECSENNAEKSQFSYVDPKNRVAQIEMQQVATEHLKKIDAYLKPNFQKVIFDDNGFNNEASVIIPVKNRAKTITAAVNSALNQKTKFSFNVIIIDNHSTDGTTELLKEISLKDNRVLHIIPKGKYLKIGGCWNEGISNKSCGRFSCQLDSDDLYKNETTLQKIINKFYDEKCAMVIGSYQLTDFSLDEIPPGIIDHKEWTIENGRNNALRINGLGAPRAFYTPLIRSIKFPDVSYGEDYAVALAVSRNYNIGRIYEPIYICRRWDGNTDSTLTVEQQNKNNFYKDKIRTIEICTRQKMNL